MKTGLIGLIALALLGSAVWPTAALGQQGQKRAGEQRPDRGQRSRRRPPAADNAPRAGDVAPQFTLPSYDGESETSIADFQGKKPVVLFFGSYT